MVILLTLYFIIAVLTAVIFTYYIGNDKEGIGYIVIVSLLWPLVMPFVIICVIFISDVRDELDNVFKK